jgi:asparagine synthase (glutamine-hydrolysing)
VAKRLKGRKKVAVSFSGGLDSSLIALLASRETEVVLCSVNTPGSRDAEQAKVGAGALGLELVEVTVDGTGMDRELQSLDLPFEPSPMDKALWCIYSSTSRAAAENGAELIMLGQLADELFGGYMKYARAAKESEEASAAMMLADVVASGEKAFVRDEEACARFTEVRFPFADDKLASYALAIPMGYKVAGGERKVVLRKAALMLGLPEILAAAPKKAAQYSSGVSKLVP